MADFNMLPVETEKFRFALKLDAAPQISENCLVLKHNGKVQELSNNVV